VAHQIGSAVDISKTSTKLPPSIPAKAGAHGWGGSRPAPGWSLVEPTCRDDPVRSRAALSVAGGVNSTPLSYRIGNI
jgi:hypothetical protein